VEAENYRRSGKGNTGALGKLSRKKKDYAQGPVLSLPKKRKRGRERGVTRVQSRAVSQNGAEGGNSIREKEESREKKSPRWGERKKKSCPKKKKRWQATIFEQPETERRCKTGKRKSKNSRGR